MTPAVGTRQFRNRKGIHCVQVEYRPECAAALVGSRVTFDGGKRGTHEGGGWVRIFGDGEHYDFLGRTH